MSAAAVPAGPSRGQPWLSPVAVAAVALAVRAIAAALSDRVVADVLRYHQVATHVLDVSWNPYLTRHLYPYPPAWVWVEVGAEWLARHAGVPFSLAVKAPVVLADALVAGLLASWVRERGGATRWAGWAYAVHPVALLVVGFHGQFDSVALLALLCALRALDRGHPDRSALALAAGIALKPFPVLVLPFALLFLPGRRARIRYAVLATVPVALLLLPFAVADRAALVRELFAYGGIPDFGWIGAVRALRAYLTGRVARATAQQWLPLESLSKGLFLAVAGALWWAVAAGRLRWRVEASALGVLLAFQVFYGALSAQYLLWPVPLAVLLGERFLRVHAAAATMALLGFYLFLAPGVLTPADAPVLSPEVALRFWVVGTALVWLVSAAWLADLVWQDRSAGVRNARARAALGTAALFASSVLVAGLVAEAALRLVRYEPQRFHNTARVVDPRWRALLDCYPTNPRGYFDIDLRDAATRERYRWMAPVRLDAVARRAPWAVEFRYNALRFRDVELGPKPSGVRRVMVLGDSFTEGQGVKEPDTYPRRLEALLNASGTGRWEVRNCGRRASDFPELYAAFEQILPYQPDVIVYGMVLNDADRSPEFQARQSYVNDWILDRGRILEGGAPPGLGALDSRLAALVSDRVESYRTSRATLRWYREMYGEPNREGWARTAQYLREMNQRTRAAGGRFLVVSWPLLVSLERYPFADVQETVARLCVSAGIPRHDLLPVLQGRPTESLWVHPVDMHPNEVAHRLAAESLVQPVLALR